MARILVVDDNPRVAMLLRSLLERAGHEVDTAGHGGLALSVINHTPPELVVTDLRMPVMDGLQLVEVIRASHPSIPVILTTGVGSEEVAVQALQKGAASYVPKANLEQEIVGTVKNVLGVATAQKQRQLLLHHLERCEAVFNLNTDLALVTPLVSHLDEMLQRLEFCDEAGRIRLGIALHEAVINAMVHGNLEISSDCRESEDPSYSRLLNHRLTSQPWRSRRVRVEAHVSRTEARFVIADDGPGFDPGRLPSPIDPTNIERVTGRGLFLIRTFLDEVRHNARGNEITMIKRREPPGG